MKIYKKVNHLIISDHMKDDVDFCQRIKTKNKEIDEQNTRFELYGIPPYAEKLEKYHNYYGNGEGHFEILYILGDFYFINNENIDICDYIYLSENFNT